MKKSQQQHAEAVLNQAASWKWSPAQRIQQSRKQSGNFEAITHELLLALIIESEKLGGTILTQFWSQMGSCHPRLEDNITTLQSLPFISDEHSLAKLLEGLQLKEIDFSPVVKMAREYFTHLGVVFMNLGGGPKSGSGTAHSVSNVIQEGTDDLLESLENSKLGNRRQATLKALAFKRDGSACLLTGEPFTPVEELGVDPILAHVIPNSIHSKPDTLACIAMLAGEATRDLVVRSLNGIGNVMNLEMNAHKKYNVLAWGIEATEHHGKIKYTFRAVPRRGASAGSPRPVRLNSGDEINFGKGPSGQQLSSGPLPILCNLQLAVARIMKASGAADVIMELKDKADDGEFPRVFIASEQFLDILDAKLMLSGRVLDIRWP